MTLRRNHNSCITTVLLVFLLGIWGCEGPQGFKQGQAAEKRGDAHVAYDYYYRALQASPSDGTAREALERVAPTAAAYWHAEARAAMAQNRVVDAWRQAMRCLDIQPDHAEALELIRKIESEHPVDVATARQNYQKRGLSSLPASRSTRTAPPAQTSAAKLSVPTAEPAPATPVGPAKVQEQKTPVKVVKPVETPEGGAAITRTLSLRDVRYRGMVRAVDGVSIKLKDTDDDGEAEFDLYVGGRKFAKVRDFSEGDTRRFRGKSGKLHEMKLLHVDDKTHTATVEIYAPRRK